MRCASMGRLQDGRRPLGMRRATEPSVPPRVNKAFGTPRTAGSVEAAMNPGAVWVNGVVGEPEVIGPAGSVWVTRSGQEEPEDSPPSSERKGRPGTLGHESILELWLKVQAMRVASGCWEGSRVELHPIPAGEGPVEKGVPGRASWIETSRDGVTGPWVRGHTRAFPRASRLPSARGIGAGCERPSVFCRQGQAGKTPPAVGGPGVEEKIDCAASGPWKQRQTVGVPVAIGWSEAVKTSRAGDVMECGGVQRGGQSVQVSGALAEEAVYGPMLWERGQIVGPPDALMVSPRTVEDETPSQGATGLWQRRQEMEDMGSRGTPGLGAMGQSVGVPCARVEGARCGGDPGSWGTAQAAELSASEEQGAGSRGAQGLWGIEQAMGAPRALGKEADDAGVPGLWGTGQLPGLQTVVVSGDRGEEASYSVSGLWERQQALGTPLAEALPGPVMEETHGGSLLSLWEREQVMSEQEAQGPAALEVAGAMGQDACCGALSCPWGRGRAVGVFETVAMPKHTCAPESVPSTLGITDALWVCQESSSADALNLQERAHAAFGRPVAPEECLSIVEDAESGPLSGSQGRRQAVGVPMALEIPGSLEVEAGSRGFSGLSGRSVGIPVTAEVSPAGVGMTPRTSSSVFEHTNSRRVSESAESRPPIGISVTVGLPEAMGDETLAEGLQRRQSASMPVATRIATTVGDPLASGLFGPYRVVDSACGDSSGAWQRRLITNLSSAARVPKLEMQAGSESVSDLWRRHSGTVPEVVRGAFHQGMLATVGVPVVGCVPPAVWVTGSPGEEANGGVSDLTVVRRQSTEGGRASGEETGSRGILGLSGRGQAVGMSYTRELGARMWGSPRSVGEEITYENIPRVSAMRTPVPSVSREETGPGHFRDNLQGNGGRAAGVAHEARVRANDLGERREGGLRGTSQ